MGNNWIRDIAESEDRDKKQRIAIDKPFGMLVTSVSSTSETGKWSYSSTNDREIQIPHPFISMGSWIRAIPETGTSYVAAFRGDEPQPQPLITFQRQAESRVSSYLDGEGVYRPLLPGEIELSSSGLAQEFFSSRARHEGRAGILARWEDQDSLTLGQRGPIHTKYLLQHVSGEVGDEYRLGIVSRPKDKKTGGKSTWQMGYPKVRGDFAAEEYLMLKNPANEAPAILTRRQQGHVLDDDGEPILQQVTQVPLRYREELYANDDTFTVDECDEKGNWYKRLAEAALEGYEFIIPSGFYKKTVAKDEVITITENRDHAIGLNASHTVGENLKYIVQKNVQIKSELGGANFVLEATPGAEKIFMTSKSGHSFVLDDTSGKESIYLIHKGGSQFVFDQTNSVKIISANGNMLFLDDSDGAVTLASSKGAFVAAKDTLTMSDKSGKQIITLDGSSKIQVSADSEVVLNAKNISIASGGVNIGNNAIFSAVIGETLATLFDAHIHAGVLGPTSPPLPPMTAALVNAVPITAFISQFVKIRGNLA